ncbi:PMCA-type calcium-translocating P-type ATPase [Hesseltinella vesiculosa]|uniref:Calcium-transporting ATPase n=1 Tax=Hesseltinella vesiculosa TaxID=101127 RepID=A0A1X2G7K5_9FUNG|nr:PMCA-type calcium-translocating P-type ATPase [Hesseltinella vesiculosa]
MTESINSPKEQHSDVTVDHVQINIVDTSPHQDEHNPFAFTPSQLAILMDPKNLPLLAKFGGLKGVTRGLHADVDRGLPIDPTTEQIHDRIDLGHITESSSIHSTMTPSSQYHSRAVVFGNNVLPSVKSKNIFQLMWLAFNDKTLILLTVAAAVSLAVGLYEDITTVEYDAEGNRIAGVRWVEGVAIIVAVCIVVLVGSVNDFQKERQFRKLNAKNEDREVKTTRDGLTRMISVHNILVGDVIHLEPGDIVAADGIFIEGHNLKCDESAATGESDAVRKQSWEVCYRRTNTHKDSALDDIPSPVNEKKSTSPTTESKSTPDPFILSGSKVIEGVCTYLVTGVGVHSYNGRTMMALRTESQTTPLQEKLNGLASMIAKFGSAAGLAMLVAVLIRYFVGWKTSGQIPTHPTQIVQDVMDIVIVVVTIIVVAVPEGLPLAVTLALAYATQRMLKDNNLVRVLAACETMGNATTVCSDKTGTLTQNKMTVVAGTFGTSFRFAKEVPEGKSLIALNQVHTKAPKAVLQRIHDSIAINSTAFETKDDNGQLVLVGNKTETALLSFAQDTGAEHHDTLRHRYPVEQVFPFSSTRKAMATVVRVPHPTDPQRIIYRAFVKGASEILLNCCGKIVSLKPIDQSHQQQDLSSTSQPQQDDAIISQLPLPNRSLTDEDEDRMARIIKSYASRSLRTIGLAYRDFDQWPPASYRSEETSDIGESDVPFDVLIDEKELTLLGVVGIEDPLRPGVKEAVRACQQAGVFVRMVTGDNMVTAKSIAKQCGIYTSGGLVMEGPVFRNLPAAEMDAILPRLQVLARSSPEDKQILVGRLQDLGDIVAVTGDGTNDGPALKLADVGFSMGIAGTEVAKEASSIILMDDNFSSIVKAILWGRCVNDSVKKFLEFQLTVNITAVILTFISAVVSENHKSVLTAVQLLWVNLIMDTFAALALATDPPTEELLHRAPEPRSAPLITFKMWKMIIGQAIFQVVVTLVLLYSDILEYDSESATLQTIVFNTFVFCQIFNEINCRRIDSKLNVFFNIWANKFFLFIFVLCVFLQCIIVNFGGAAFQVTRINGVDWAISIILGLLSLPIGAVIRLIPDESFAFLFRNPTTRQRYLGIDSNNTMTTPSVYVTGNDRVAWNTGNSPDAPPVNVGVSATHSSDKLSQFSSLHSQEDATSITPPNYDLK